jgi:GTP cyclohydrolase I
MSRPIEVLQRHREALDLPGLVTLLEDARARLEADSVQAELRFPLFFSRSAPVSGATGLLDVDVTLRGFVRPGGRELWLEIAVPVQSLCPCSKAVSDYGAHNQRGLVTLAVRPAEGVQELPLEELVAIAEAHASAPIYPVLKRPDERHVTMQAYDTPVFVEDMARGVATALEAREDVAAYRVHVANDESIHNHQAVAELAGGDAE